MSRARENADGARLDAPLASPTFSGTASFSDGNITNLGNIALDTISSDAGTSIGVTLGTDAGDDFNVGSGKLVVEGDTGNVGIGTDAPSKTGGLTIAANNPGIKIDSVANTGWGTVDFWGTGGGGLPTSAKFIMGYHDLAGKFGIQVGTNIAGSTGIQIDSSGNVGIGTGDPGYALDVRWSGAARVVNIQNTSTSSGTNSSAALQIIKGHSDQSTSQRFVKFQTNAGTQSNGVITADGANAAQFYSTSDERLKENIATIPSQLANILALRPVEFDFIGYEAGEGYQIGFIAQEMNLVYPDVVSADTDGMLGIAGWSKTEARLVSAIQELSAKVTALENA